MKSLIKLFFVVLNFLTVGFSLVLFILTMDGYGTYNILLLSLTSACLLLNFVYLIFIIYTFSWKSLKSKKNYYTADTIQKNIVIRSTLPMDQ